MTLNSTRAYLETERTRLRARLAEIEAQIAAIPPPPREPKGTLIYPPNKYQPDLMDLWHQGFGDHGARWDFTNPNCPGRADAQHYAAEYLRDRGHPELTEAQVRRLFDA